MSKCRKIAYFLTVVVVLFFSLSLGAPESSAESIYLPLIMNSFPPKFTVMIAEGGKVTVSPQGTLAVQKGEKIALEITPENSDVVPILLINGKPVESTKSGMIYKYDLTVVGDTSVYATSAVEPKLTVNAKAMDEATVNCLTSISADGSVLIFNCITPYLQALQSGDVIIIGVTEATPYGLLRKVMNVTIEGSQVTVETTQATLEDAFEEGEIIISKALTASDIKSFVPLAKGVTLQEAMLGSVQSQTCLNLKKFLFDADGNENTTNDQISLNGGLCLDPTVNFALGIGIHWKYWVIPVPTLKNLVFSVGLSESFALDLIANYTYSFDKEIPIADIYLEPIVIPPFIVLVPNLTVFIGFKGSITAGIRTGFTQEAGLEAGLHYSHGDWSPINSCTSSFGYSLPTLSALEADARIYMKPQFNLLIYGVAGPYVNLEGYFESIMQPLYDPWLSLWGGIDAGVGVLFKVYSKTVADYGDSFPIIREPILKLPGNKPPTITSFTASRTKVFTGETSTITLDASDPENDHLTCSWEASAGSLSSKTGCGPVSWTAPGDAGRYTVLVSITDNWPGHSPVTRGIAIDVQQNLPPIITSLTPDNPSVILGGTSSVKLVASDPEGDPLTCSWLTNGGTLSSTTGCDSVIWTAIGDPGTYTISVSVTDNRPGHTKSISTTITVVTAAGCANLNSPANGAVLDNGCSNLGNLLTWDFAWSACSGTTQYNIYVKHPNDATPRIDTVVNTTSYHYEGYFTVDDSHLSGWRWKVRAMVNGYWGDWSLERGFDVEPLNTDCTPGAPTNLSASDGRYRDRVRLTWTAPTTGGTPTGYRIYRYISNISSAATEIGTSTTTSYDDYVGDTNTYWYWVKAHSNTGMGPYSNGNSGYQRALAQVETGQFHTVGLKADGTVVAVGDNTDGQLNVGSWTNIAQVAAGGRHTVGLKADGTVVAVGWNNYGQLDVSSWSGIIQVSAGYSHTVGLKADGTVVAVGWNNYGQLDVGSWSGITQVAAGGIHTVGLKADGTVLALGRDFNGMLYQVGLWTNITQVAVGDAYTVGLKADGTVLAAGDNTFGQLDVSSWSGIIQVAGAVNHAAGLKADGTAVAVGRNIAGQLDVSSWSGIIQVDGGYENTVGLKADGTVMAAGNNNIGQLDVSGWDLQ